MNRYASDLHSGRQHQQGTAPATADFFESRIRPLRGRDSASLEFALERLVFVDADAKHLAAVRLDARAHRGLEHRRGAAAEAETDEERDVDKGAVAKREVRHGEL